MKKRLASDIFHSHVLFGAVSSPLFPTQTLLIVIIFESAEHRQTMLLTAKYLLSEVTEFETISLLLSSFRSTRRACGSSGRKRRGAERRAVAAEAAQTRLMADKGPRKSSRSLDRVCARDIRSRTLSSRDGATFAELERTFLNRKCNRMLRS